MIRNESLVDVSAAVTEQCQARYGNVASDQGIWTSTGKHYRLRSLWNCLQGSLAHSPIHSLIRSRLFTHELLSISGSNKHNETRVEINH